MILRHKKLFWTQHSQIKMRQYGLSKQKLLGILARPERKEKGIVPGTLAAMRTNKIFFKAKQISLDKAWQKSKRTPGEIWIMFKDVKSVSTGNARKIISAWRYPGVSKPGEAIPIPEDIKQDIIRGII